MLNIEKWQVYVVCKSSLLKLLQDFEEKNVLDYVFNSLEADLCKYIISLLQSVQPVSRHVLLCLVWSGDQAAVFNTGSR